MPPFRTMRALCLLAAVAGGCATPEPPPAVREPVPELPPRAEPAAAPTPPPAAETRNTPLKHLANRDLKPIPTRPLNASAHCAFRDETGYRGKLRLNVREAAVRDFDARVDIPRKGSCRFRLADFRQAESLPTVMLAARRGDCKVSLWEQGEMVTVAFRGCRDECSGTSSDYLWPILVDNQKGACS